MIPVQKCGELNQVVSGYLYKREKKLTEFFVAYLMTPWEVIEPGEHKFPFALKVRREREREREKKPIM